MVRDALQLTGRETVLDAYAGVGTFAVLLSPDAEQVIAVEESTAAIADALENAAGLANVRFVTGKVEDVLPDLQETPDAVVLDPSVPDASSRRWTRCSDRPPNASPTCPATRKPWRRDLRTLCRRYRVESVQPVDMFPQTHHVECVATLTLKSPAADIVLASASPRRRELLSVWASNSG